jgi:hypothetical protein
METILQHIMITDFDNKSFSSIINILLYNGSGKSKDPVLN